MRVLVALCIHYSFWLSLAMKAIANCIDLSNSNNCKGCSGDRPVAVSGKTRVQCLGLATPTQL
ncbi:MAG: hypothetical protein RMY64_32250 [Nostoc sp. DedQUE08]|nr:hypothetical protein [Nostoc sp. DedQUE08]